MASLRRILLKVGSGSGGAKIERLSNSDFNVKGMIWAQEQGSDYRPIGVAAFIDTPVGYGGWDFRRV